MQFIYPYDSIGIPIEVTDKGSPVAMAYAPGATMDNPANGYGLLWASVFDQDGALVADTLGSLIQNVYAEYSGNPVQQGQLTIREGILLPGQYSVQPYFGINTPGDTIDWRKMAVQWFTVSPYLARTDLPVS